MPLRIAGAGFEGAAESRDSRASNCGRFFKTVILDGERKIGLYLGSGWGTGGWFSWNMTGLFSHIFGMES